MAVLEEVKQMQAQGLPEDQIIQTLQQRGVQYKDISEALAQSKIKAAIEEPVSEPSASIMQQPAQQQMQPQAPPTAQPVVPGTTNEISTAAPATSQTIETSQAAPMPAPEAPMPQGMQQSIMQTAQVAAGEPQATQEYVPTPEQEYMPYPEQQYQEYEYSPAGISSDTIVEISEQVVTERLGDVRKHLDRVVDFKTAIEAKTEALDQRLKRMEKIIDTLQAAVLRKVGDYVTNVDDIKQELIQTQKSFAKLLPEIRKTGSPHKKTQRKKTHKKK